MVISLKRIGANLLVSQGVFDFKLFRYGVAQESVERSWLSRLLGRGNTGFGSTGRESMGWVMKNLVAFYLSTKV